MKTVSAITQRHRGGELTPEQVRIYDSYADAFAIIHNNLDAAMQAANITGGDGGSVEGIHGSLIGGEEAHMGAVADGGGAAVEGALDPEFGIFAAPGDRARVFEDAFAAEGGEDLVIEGNRLVEAIAAQGNVGKDAGVLFGHGAFSLNGQASLAGRRRLTAGPAEWRLSRAPTALPSVRCRA